jgi:hypothetical protein
MVLEVWTTTARHGEPCMSPRGTAKDESPRVCPARQAGRRAFCAGGLHKNPSQSPPYALRKGEKQFVSLDSNGF